MAYDTQHLDFEEFAQHLPQVFERLKEEKIPILVDRNGDTFRLEVQQLANIWKNYDPERVQAALRASAGALTGLDIDELMQDLDAQREQGRDRFV